MPESGVQRLKARKPMSTQRPSSESSAAMAELRAVYEKQQKEIRALLANIKARLSELTALLQKVSSHWHGEDRFYRFYHQSFKVYDLQGDTQEIVAALRQLRPEKPFNAWFEQIVREGTGKVFDMSHNARWLQEPRPILEAGQQCCICIICDKDSEIRLEGFCI